ncbi:hypothetical protein INS49_000394 [Diaporthe citri]|uniref:uncharacterized protein n=1 Tax=Diaporthe citri TaxID=83186 RepID=UPI001C7F4DC6|nr:uncharacterized protein INS49_000394 [Diaporthe citri]KAG6366218.1 hypothetical protein INS49_000394 [Diaporthe citri]
MASNNWSVERLMEELYRAQCINASGKDFLPAGALKEVITPEVVRSALQGSQADVQLCEYAEKICGSYRKIFAILVLVDMVHRIPDFMRCDLDDTCLPMPDTGMRNGEALPTPLLEDEAWMTVTRTWRRRDIDQFKTYQWRVLAPAFTAQDPEYRLCPSHVLPFVESHEQAEGAFGTVYRVRIHPDHHDFGNLGMNTQDSMFAVKEIRKERHHDYYDAEVRILRRLRDFSFGHIIPLLASYEIRSEHDDFSSRRYLIFPWASGDLDAFYRRNEVFPDRTQMILWMAEQSSGLANALCQIHGGNEDPSPGSPTNASIASEASPFAPDSARMYGRHGDIKPSNILWFDEASTETANGIGRLVLSDFGLAHYHRRNSRSNVTSEAVARSATYRAPEFDMGMKLSRKIDIWSLGCLFLEMLTWLLRGYKVMHDDFSQSRLEESSDLSHFFEDTFFRIVPEDGRRTAVVKRSVKAWIMNLLDNPCCSLYTRDFLTMIEHHMIVVDVNDRISAAELSQMLRDMYSRCTEDVSYYREGMMGLSSVPLRLLPLSQPTAVGGPTLLAPASTIDAAAASEPVQEAAAAHLKPADRMIIGPSSGTFSQKFRRSAGRMSLLGWPFRLAKDKSQGTGQADKPAASGP